MPKEFESQETEVSLGRSAQKILSGPRPELLEELSEKIFDYLSLLDRCPDAVWSVILNLLGSNDLLSSPYSNSILRNLLVCEFHFSEGQKEQVAALLKERYELIADAENRIVALSIILEYDGLEAGALALLALAKQARQASNFVGDLVWELNGLRRKPELSKSTRAKIEAFLANS